MSSNVLLFWVVCMFKVTNWGEKRVSFSHIGNDFPSPLIFLAINGNKVIAFLGA